jgi:hypothetical protein
LALILSAVLMPMLNPAAKEALVAPPGAPSALSCGVEYDTAGRAQL